jgi:hypothetical protein
VVSVEQLLQYVLDTKISFTSIQPWEWIALFGKVQFEVPQWNASVVDVLPEFSVWWFMDVACVRMPPTFERLYAIPHHRAIVWAHCPLHADDDEV